MTRFSASRALLLASLLLPLAAAGTAEAQQKKFTLNADFDPGIFNNSVDTNPVNQIVLGPTPVSKTTLVWATNYLYGWVVRINSLNGKQTSRFDSSLQFINGIATGAPAPNEYCNFSSTGNCPGRVAVDTLGDVWIVNRAFGKQGTLSKFSGDIQHCIDRNNNGVIDTSVDVNNDGQISVVAGSGEYFGQNDECILTTVKIGAVNMWPRGVAVDKRGKIWVATHQDGKVYRFNPNEPVNLETTITTGGTPYSLATGGDYLFVSSSSANSTKRVHITTGAVNTLACPAGTYGVVGDPGGNIAWLGGYFSNNNLYRANFSNNTCTGFNTGSQVTAVTMDLAGNIWACGYNTHVIHKYSPAGVLLGTYPAGGTNPHGMSVDFQGNLWVINHGPTPSITKVNVNTGAIIGTYPLGGPGVPNGDPYLYSDFTGVQIDRQAPYTRIGSWEGVHDGGVNDIPWAKLQWNTEPQGATPAETSIKMSVRAANTQAELGTKPYLQVVNNAAFAGIPGRFVQVRAELAGPGFVTPAVSDVTVFGPCDPLGPNCCVTNNDCNDGDVCTVDSCPAPGAACEHAPIFDCCANDADCNDTNQCTVDTCNVAMNQCVHTQQANCCNSNTDCDDGVFCTVDLCSGQGGSCTNTAINGCCETNAECDDGNSCTVDVCPPNNLCQHTPTPGCCTNDVDCKENPDDLCTINTCDIATGTCGVQDLKPQGCCNVDPDCNDDDPCTTDTCSGPGGTCQHQDDPTCCTPNDPDIGAPCDLPQSPYDQPPCKAGELVCVNGQFDCVGAVKPGLEVCDGLDNDCNGFPDTPANCPGEDICLWGQCVSESAGGEFPCQEGFVEYQGYCVPTDCSNTVCPDGQVCVGGLCQDGGGGSGPGGGGPGGGGPGGSGPGGSGPGGSGPGGSSAGGAGGDTNTTGTAAGGPGDTSTDDSFGLVSGGGGCRCNVPGDDERSNTGLVAALAALAVMMSRKRRRDVRQSLPRTSRGDDA